MDSLFSDTLLILHFLNNNGTCTKFFTCTYFTSSFYTTNHGFPLYPFWCVYIFKNIENRIEIGHIDKSNIYDFNLIDCISRVPIFFLLHFHTGFCFQSVFCGTSLYYLSNHDAFIVLVMFIKKNKYIYHWTQFKDLLVTKKILSCFMALFRKIFTFTNIILWFWMLYTDSIPNCNNQNSERLNLCYIITFYYDLFLISFKFSYVLYTYFFVRKISLSSYL